MFCIWKKKKRKENHVVVLFGTLLTCVSLCLSHKIPNSLKTMKPYRSIKVWLCLVHVCVTGSSMLLPSLPVSSRQLEADPAWLLSGKAWTSLWWENCQLLYKSMVQLPWTCTHALTQTCTHWWLKGFTSPRPKQQSMQNFDPSHYLSRHWGLDGGW